MRVRFTYLVLLLILTVSCGRTPRIEERSPASTPLPQAVILEREISGVILGEQLRRPFGLAVDRSGAVYVSDFGNNRIVKFDPELKAVDDIGGFGTAEGLLNRPTFLTLDNELNLLVADEGNRRVCRFNPRLEYVESLDFSDEADPLAFGRPAGIGVTDYGEIWVADPERNRIAVFNNLGAFDRFLAEFGYSGGQVHGPAEIVTMTDGSFLVCDAGNKRLLRYDQYGNYEESWRYDELEQPVAAAVTRYGVWVADSFSGQIHLFDRAGNHRFVFGRMLVGSATSMKEPRDVIALADGRLLISDSGNDRLLVCRVVFDES